MGKRREPRKDIKVPVRIFGTDSSGQIFSEKVFTINVSRCGAELINVQARLNADEIIGLTYGTTKVHFRIKWVGALNTAKTGRLGLQNLTPEKPLWDFPLPDPSDDGSWRDARDRRSHPRLKCICSTELYPEGQTAPLRTRTTDISLGGCFIEMNLPLPKGTPVKIALWIKDSKLWATGKVVTSTPGFGIGVQFAEISEPDRHILRQFLQSNIRISTL